MTGVIERDTDEREDIANLYEFLLPDNDVLNTASAFGLHYNRDVFGAWVRQPSPCCAAASVAGAWNALCGLHRSHPQALSHLEVLDIYRDLVREKMEKKTASFERKLGASLDTDFWREFEALAAGYGREIAGKKGSNVTKSVAEKVLREMVRSESESKTEDDGNIVCFSVKRCLWEIFQSEGVNLNELSLQSSVDDCDDEPDLPVEESEPPSSKNNASSSSSWQWRTDFMEILRHKAGLAKLCAERASTAFIGNWGILSATSALSEQHGLGTQVSARLFMGKRKTTKTKMDVPLSKKDDEGVIAGQWDVLRCAFARPRQVLLVHWSNHYALIFALREWRDSEGTCVRQLLTARRGQRPSAWVDFNEMRDALLGWDGYKIMALLDESPKLNNPSIANDSRSSKK